MKENPNPCQTVVGIDISKKELVIGFAPPQPSWEGPWVFANDEQGIAELIPLIQGTSLVVMEATGGLERQVRGALAVANIPTHLANPYRARQFAESFSGLAKTDRVDAQMLAEMGKRYELTPDVLNSDSQQELCALMSRRQTLIHLRDGERRRLHSCHQVVRESIEREVQHLEQGLKHIESLLQERVSSEQEFQQQATLIQSVPGIGPVSAWALLAYLPELGQVSSKQLAAIVGVAPYAKDSGTTFKRRRIQGGRHRLRRVLYMAALVAIQHNSVMRVFYQRLLAHGKLKKVALVACVRKLLVWLNAMIRQQTHWDPQRGSRALITRE